MSSVKKIAMTQFDPTARLWREEIEHRPSLGYARFGNVNPRKPIEGTLGNRSRHVVAVPGPNF